MVPAEQIEDASVIVKELLTEHFGEGLTFGPIIIEPKLDHDDDAILVLTILYEGDRSLLAAQRLFAFERHVQTRLIEQKIDDFLYLVTRYSLKSEWEALMENRHLEKDPYF